MMEKRFRIEQEPIEITTDGWLSGQPDTFRRFRPGTPRYFVDDLEVTKDEFDALLAAEDA